ncbi:MAG: hypothetical protein PVG49_08065 [Desulfobacteraceae bacterium]|jgi:hypothetical protein
MPQSNHPAMQPATTKVTRFVPQATLAMGGLGAIIGGSAAAARNIRRVKDEEINREEAVRNTIKEAAGAGLATAAATAVVGAVGATGLLSLLGILSLATGTKYFWDIATTPEKAPAAAREKPKPKKTTKSKSKEQTTK